MVRSLVHNYMTLQGPPYDGDLSVRLIHKEMLSQHVTERFLEGQTSHCYRLFCIASFSRRNG